VVAAHRPAVALPAPSFEDVQRSLPDPIQPPLLIERRAAGRRPARSNAIDDLRQKIKPAPQDRPPMVDLNEERSAQILRKCGAMRGPVDGGLLSDALPDFGSRARAAPVASAPSLNLSLRAGRQRRASTWRHDCRRGGKAEAAVADQLSAIYEATAAERDSHANERDQLSRTLTRGGADRDALRHLCNDNSST
jgi:hypothetical protein